MKTTDEMADEARRTGKSFNGRAACFVGRGVLKWTMDGYRSSRAAVNEYIAEQRLLNEFQGN